MSAYTDQLGRKIELPCVPKKIISLVPSQTELLFDLGLEEEIAGITKFCIHPEKVFRTKTRVGGTKNIKFEKIRSLNPDLIIANKEENEEAQVKELMRHHPVWVSDIKTLDDSCRMITSIGEVTGKAEKANEIAKDITARFKDLESEILDFKILQAAYFIWKKPYMAAGSDTFIDHLLGRCGLKNVFGGRNRYPEVTPEEIIRANPETILLSSEPYPFKEKHMDEFRQMLPRAKVMVVDGELFSWYGTRLLHSPGYFLNLRKEINCIR